MKIQKFSAFSLLTLSACASIFDGTSQQIMVNTNPPGASCQLSRKEGVIGQINATPASTTIRKTKNDITITCNEPGYQQATYIDHSGVAGATYADIIGGGFGLIAWGIDSSAGADNKYDSPVNITLVPLPQPVAAPVAAPGAIAPQTPGTIPPLVHP